MGNWLGRLPVSGTLNLGLVQFKIGPTAAGSSHFPEGIRDARCDLTALSLKSINRAGPPFSRIGPKLDGFVVQYRVPQATDS